eukprot:351493-Hanusia_phi.AAC.4
MSARILEVIMTLTWRMKNDDYCVSSRCFERAQYQHLVVTDASVPSFCVRALLSAVSISDHSPGETLLGIMLHCIYKLCLILRRSNCYFKVNWLRSANVGMMNDCQFYNVSHILHRSRSKLAPASLVPIT